MDPVSLGGLYLENQALPSVARRAAAPKASFAEVLDAASAPSAPVSAKDLPRGAAANSGPQDAERAAASAKKVDRTSKLYEQCRELEGFVVKTLLEGMRKTVQKSGLVDGGFAGKMYEDMLYDEYAKNLTANGGFGLADQAYLELSRSGGSVSL